MLAYNLDVHTPDEEELEKYFEVFDIRISPDVHWISGVYWICTSF